MMLETEPKGGQRRSSRVFTRIPVRATGRDLLGKKFQETSQTIVINAHGGLLYLQAELKVGAELVLIKPGHGRRTRLPRRLPRRHIRKRHPHRRRISFSQPALLGSRIRAAGLAHSRRSSPGPLVVKYFREPLADLTCAEKP